jgi:hypothetical protein
METKVAATTYWMNGQAHEPEELMHQSAKTVDQLFA